MKIPCASFQSTLLQGSIPWPSWTAPLLHQVEQAFHSHSGLKHPVSLPSILSLHRVRSKILQHRTLALAKMLHFGHTVKFKSNQCNRDVSKNLLINSITLKITLS